MAVFTIDDSNWAERARLRCPEGHGWWEVYDSAWYCRSCARSYAKLVDTKTGDWVAPEDVRLLTGHRKR